MTVGCTYGAMLHDRYLEVRYEELCAPFEPAARDVLTFINCSMTEEAIATCRPKVYAHSIAKHLKKPREMINEILDIEKPLLLSLGYLDSDPFTPLVPRLSDKLKGTFRL